MITTRGFDMTRFGIALILALPACQPVEAPAEEDLCGAANYQSLIGANIAAVTLPADLNARVIGPDTAVTMDFVLERLNVEFDAAGIIQRVRCG
ncbi:MAG: I78 family peptidase inhibitor [Pseudomonadota bacterium]